MDTANFSIRIPQELKEKLDEMAKADHRSTNNLINLILMKYVSEHTSGGE